MKIINKSFKSICYSIELSIIVDLSDFDFV